jgi:4-amino-4-deoxy-L-arabinose transferase-like glycosyltransferase
LRGFRAALLAALVLTAANAVKPLVIDDPVYVEFARQALAHPGDPYGFEVYWYRTPEPAIRFGWVPPVLSYWLAGAIALFGEHPAAWKLSLFPFALALTGSLLFLLRRQAAPLAAPVVLLLALGPALLPSFNLMLDVPALALGVLGYALFAAAAERRHAWLALASGLALGLAMQTKYSAAVYPALVLAHAAVYRRPREAAVALVAAAALFIGWEAWLITRYGESHFLAGLERLRTLHYLPAVARADAEAPGSKALYWTICLLSLLGGTALFPALLAGVALGATRAAVSGAALAVAAALAAIAWLPRRREITAEGFFARLTAHNPELLVFVPLGLLSAGIFAAVALRALRSTRQADRRPDLLLAVWLLLETAGYFLISPYPAARRVIGVGVAATLLAARTASPRSQEPEARGGIRVAIGFGALLSALYFAADLSDARARQALAARIAERVPQLGADAPRETVWYNGHWELQFYLARAGMQPVIAGRSHLRPGDWLILSEGTAPSPLSFPASRFRQQDELVAVSGWPWSTIPLYYDGPVPLRRQGEMQSSARIFRVTRDWVSQLQSDQRSSNPE